MQRYTMAEIVNHNRDTAYRLGTVSKHFTGGGGLKSSLRDHNPCP